MAISSTRRFALGWTLAAALPAFLLASEPGWAAGTNLYASVNGDANGNCLAPGLPCTLRRALSVAADGDVVSLQAGTYLESGLVISKAIQMVGTGSNTILDGGSADRILTSNPGSGDTVTIDLIKFRNGAAPSAQPEGGGAILVDSGALEVRDSEFVSNTGFSGGAISCYIGCEALTVRRTLLEENTGTSGGAIFSMGEAKVFSSQFNRNSASSIGGAFYAFSSDLEVHQSEFARNEAPVGGGVAAQLGSAEILQSLLVRNVATSGGGVFVFSDGPETLTVRNSTFFENQADSGGAIQQGGNVAVTIVNATFADNQASGFGNGADLEVDGTATVTLEGSILTHPNLGGDRRPQCAGALAFSLQGGNNLIDTTGSCQGPAANFQRGALTPLALGPLADNGGPTRTLLPPAGSNAIGLITGNCRDPVAGSNLIEDQRGFVRPVNDCDCGAIEVQP